MDNEHIPPGTLGLQVADNISAMLAYWDKDLVCRFANSAYMQWFGYTAEEMLGKMTIDQLLGPLYRMNLPYIKAALSGKPQTFERTIILPDGRVRHSLANYIPHVKEGVVKGFYVHVADITPFIQNTLDDHSRENLVVKYYRSSIGDVEQTLRESVHTGFPGIKTLAEKHYISESKLKRDFKAHFNTTIFSHYRTLQMELAHKYLAEGNYNKRELAMLFNFSNPSNFSVCYRKFLYKKNLGIK